MKGYVIHKKSRTPGDQSYRGQSWNKAGISEFYRPVYTDKNEAEKLAAQLSRYNPVGFMVSKVEIMTDRKTKLKALGDKLYELTGHDWTLNIHHTLTEPTCPTAIIAPEMVAMSRYRVDTSSIDEAIDGAIDRVYKEIVLRQLVGHSAPYTEGQDETYDTWITKWCNGEDAPFPKLKREME